MNLQLDTYMTQGYAAGAWYTIISVWRKTSLYREWNSPGSE